MNLPTLPPFEWPRSLGRAWLVLGLIALCCVIEVVLYAADLGLIGSTRWRMLWLQNGAFWAGLLRDWQPNYSAQPWAMFGTYAFLHAGPMHLLGNMVTLLWVGPTLLQRLGTANFALLWAGSACGGAVGFTLLSNTPAPMVGASGAIFGLFGALTALDYLDRGRLSAVINMTGILVALNIVMLIVERGTLAWETHLGGYLSGVLLIAILNPHPIGMSRN